MELFRLGESARASKLQDEYKRVLIESRHDRTVARITHDHTGPDFTEPPGVTVHDIKRTLDFLHMPYASEREYVEPASVALNRSCDIRFSNRRRR